MFDPQEKRAAEQAKLICRETVFQMRQPGLRENSGSSGTCFERLGALFRQYFISLEATFDYDALQAALESIGESQQPGIDQQGAALPESVNAVLKKMVEKPCAEVRDAFIDVLAETCLAGFQEEFARWMYEFDLRLHPGPEIAGEARHWAYQKAGAFLAELAQTLEGELEILIIAGWKKGLSAKEIMSGIDDFLRARASDNESIAGMIEDLEVTASRTGALRAMILLGADLKKWITVGDDYVCSICRQNESQNWIPIGQAFSSGHLMPPAHPGCRCDLHCHGITRESALQNFSR